MSLDIAILGVDGRPSSSTSLGVQAHHRLMNVAVDRHLTQLRRLRNYYGDVTIVASDVGEFIRELELVRQVVADEPETFSAVARIVEIAKTALKGGRDIEVIAD